MAEVKSAIIITIFVALVGISPFIYQEFFKNEPPVVDFLVAPDYPQLGETTFDASECLDPDGNIVAYKWDFGDGNVSSGCRVYHRYSKSGPFIVALTVYDNDDKRVTKTKTVNINHEGSLNSHGSSTVPEPATRRANTPPEAYFSITPSNPTVNEVVTLDASVSRDPDGDIKAYKWEFGDRKISSEGPLTEHSFSKEGKFIVRLTVIDDVGEQGTKTETIEVEPESSEPQPSTNELPKAGFIFEPAYPKINEMITFDASESRDSDGDIELYMWDFADGNTSEGDLSRVVHSYSGSGEFRVRLTVIDDRGAHATETKVVQIEASIGTTGGNSGLINKEPLLVESSLDVSTLPVGDPNRAVWPTAVWPQS